MVWHPDPDLASLLQAAKCDGLAAPAWCTLPCHLMISPTAFAQHNLSMPCFTLPFTLPLRELQSSLCDSDAPARVSLNAKSGEL